jgi:hypothetical protein
VRRGARRRSAADGGTAAPVTDRDEPWGRGPLVLLVVLAGLGALGMIVGWVGVSGTADLEEQARWLGVGIGSLILAGIGMVAWLVAGLVSLATLRRSVLRDLAVRYPAEVTARREETAPLQTVGTFGIAAGMRRYHRADCDLLVGKDVRWLDAAALQGGDAIPCGMCKPDGASAS